MSETNTLALPELKSHRDEEIEKLKAENAELREKYSPEKIGALAGATSGAVAATLNEKITKLTRQVEILKKALEFYAGDIYSNIELDIFDHFKCDHKGNSEFNSKWLCKTAREALKECEGVK